MLEIRHLVCMGSAAAEETDLAHEIWYAVAEAGQADMSEVRERMACTPSAKPPGTGM